MEVWHILLIAVVCVVIVAITSSRNDTPQE